MGLILMILKRKIIFPMVKDIYIEDRDCKGCFIRPLWSYDEIDHNFGYIKMKIHNFQEKNDHKAYMKWEKKIELFLNATIIPRKRNQTSHH